jgi:hypothetical protein
MRRLLCWLGLHLSTYQECASLYVYAERCNDCGRWIDEQRGADVEAVRARHITEETL